MKSYSLFFSLAVILSLLSLTAFGAPKSRAGLIKSDKAFLEAELAYYKELEAFLNLQDDFQNEKDEELKEKLGKIYKASWQRLNLLKADAVLMADRLKEVAEPVLTEEEISLFVRPYERARATNAEAIASMGKLVDEHKDLLVKYDHQAARLKEFKKLCTEKPESLKFYHNAIELGEIAVNSLNLAIEASLEAMEAAAKLIVTSETALFQRADMLQLKMKDLLGKQNVQRILKDLAVLEKIQKRDEELLMALKAESAQVEWDLSNARRAYESSVKDLKLERARKVRASSTEVELPSTPSHAPSSPVKKSNAIVREAKFMGAFALDLMSNAANCVLIFRCEKKYYYSTSVD